MINKIKHFFSGVLTTLSCLLVVNLSAENDLEIVTKTMTIQTVNYQFEDIHWRSMFDSAEHFKESKINSLSFKMNQCQEFSKFINKYINQDENISLYELHLFDSYYEDNC